MTPPDPQPLPGLLPEPRQNCRAYLKNGVLQFRHPWLPADSTPLRYGVRKLSPTEQTAFLMEANSLLAAAPRYPHEAPGNIRPSLLDRYYQVIDRHGVLAVEVEVESGARRVEYDTIVNLKIEIAQLKRERAELQSHRDRLEAQVQMLLRASGERSTAEKNTSIRQCWVRFEERFRCRKGSKPEELANVRRRVRCVLECLGWEKPFGRVEKADLVAAVDASQPKTEAERTKRAIDLKRFFNFLCLPTAQDGLGFVNNPAARLDYYSPRALQQMRRAKGMVKTANPEFVLPKMPLYWRALYGVLCYAGLRLSEAAALSWDRIDFEKRIIKVLPSEVYDRMKSPLSERPVRPFKELWPILREYHEQRPNKILVFPRTKDPEESWFGMTRENRRVEHLSRELSAALVAAGLTLGAAEEPQRRARRYWETKMRASGRTDLIEIMGGHTNRVGLDHYTDAEPVVLAAKGPEF